MPTLPDELYTVPPDEFVRTRDALATRLSKTGRNAEATAVRRMRRPTPVIWAINRSARDDERRVARLMDAVDGLRKAMATGARELSPATQEQREALDALTQHSATILRDAGVRVSRDVFDRLRSTLLNAAADRSARGDLRAGRLSREYGASGFDLLSDMPGSGGALRLVKARPLDSVKASAETVRSSPPARIRPRPGRAPERRPTRKVRTERSGAEARRQARAAAEERTAALMRSRQLLRQAQAEAKEAARLASGERRKADRLSQAAQKAAQVLEQLQAEVAEQERVVGESKAVAATATREADQAEEAARGRQARVADIARELERSST